MSRTRKILAGVVLAVSALSFVDVSQRESVIMTQVATQMQHVVNATGGVYEGHECVISVPASFDVVARDASIMCDAAHAFDMIDY